MDAIFHTMPKAKADLLKVKPLALKCLHVIFGFDFQKPHIITHLIGPFTVNQAIKSIGRPVKHKTVILAKERHGRNLYSVVRVNSDGSFSIDIERARNVGYRYGISHYYTKKSFDEDRKHNGADAFVISQDITYIKEGHVREAFDPFARYRYVENSDRWTYHYSDSGKYLSSVTVKSMTGSGTIFDIDKYGTEKSNFSCCDPRLKDFKPASRLDIIDKSGYIIPPRRSELKRKANKLRDDRMRAEYLATNDAAKVEELHDKLQYTIRHISAFVENVTCAFDVTVLDKAVGYTGLQSAIDDFARYKVRTAARDYLSVEQADRRYNDIMERLNKINSDLTDYEEKKKTLTYESYFVNNASNMPSDFFPVLGVNAIDNPVINA